MDRKPVILCILDGWGIAPPSASNGITSCTPHNWNRFLTRYPHSQLIASEDAVGLPAGQMGNSEVGHITIGAGRIIRQDLPRINHALNHEAIELTSAFKTFVEKTKAGTGICHLAGLLSPGGVHSHQDHIIKLAKLLHNEGIIVHLHCFLDGRDTPPQSALDYVQNLQEEIKGLSVNIATFSGRYYAMDRDQRWDRTEKFYNAIVHGNAPLAPDIFSTLASFYEQSLGDEFIPPHVTATHKGMRPGDSFLMVNFRADRVRQLLSALFMPDFTNFNRHEMPIFSAALGLTDYADYLSPYLLTLFPKDSPTQTLGQIISDSGLRQLRLAETEKYAHVTFFFNGGIEAAFAGETRHLVPSPPVATYDLCPEMSAVELTNFLVEHIKTKSFDFCVVNYANADMVGHTGNSAAIYKAVKAIDACLGQLEHTCLNHDCTLIITADHGNAEQMIDGTNAPHTAHTCNPVPFMVVSSSVFGPVLKGSLQDIAPTILHLMGITPPSCMTGKSLLTETFASPLLKAPVC